MTIFIWIVTFIAIVGVILNVKQSRWGFFIWMFTNITLAIYNFFISQYSQTILFFVYFAFAVWGWFAWKKIKK